MTSNRCVIAKEYVILLHGLARSRISMLLVERTLKKAGYTTINISYPSTKYPIAKLALETITNTLARCTDATKIHFVTHSMGGILLRYYLTQYMIPNLGRSVMLGPPNNGSELVDNLNSLPGFKLINGPASLELSTDKGSTVNQLGPVKFELGVIAGTHSLNPIYSLFMPHPHDGKVSVESSKVTGMSAHISLPVSHSFMMNNKDVRQQIIHFLDKGSFSEQST